MSSNLTRRQHQVPQFYLKLWGDGERKFWKYDVINDSKRRTSAKPIFYGEYYYEEDSENPDNRIENLLGSIETECAPTLNEINNIINKYPRYSQNNNLQKELNEFLTPERQVSVKKFAAFQYLRVPGAIEQKEYELQGSKLMQSDIEFGLNPGRFVESGYEYLKDRFISMIMILDYTFDSYFVTSDWPCFDMKDSDRAPLLGEEIGKSSEVVACMALGPRVRAIFVPEVYFDREKYPTLPEIVIEDTPNSQVKNQNTLVIQQCLQYVISSKCEDFIQKVAGKRKRNNL